jgi:very-short-patch-repair endonuclease
LADNNRGATVTKQEFVYLFVEFLDSLGLPRPETDRWIKIGDRWIEADCLWRAYKVIVELDGYAVHGTRRNFESDRARDRAIHTTDWRVIRITWRQLHEERAELAADLRLLLAPTARAA